MIESPDSHRSLGRRAAVLLLLEAIGLGVGAFCRSVFPSAPAAVETAFVVPAFVSLLLGCAEGTGWLGVYVSLPSLAALFSYRQCAEGGPGLWREPADLLLLAALAAVLAWIMESAARREEADRRASEEKYGLLIDKSLSGMLVYREGRILFMNARFGRMLRCRPQDRIGRPVWEIVHEQDRSKVQALAGGDGEGQEADGRYECRLVREDGKTIWADMVSSRAEYEGAPAMLVSAYEITDKKEAEEKRKELSELARRQEEQLVHSTRLAELGEMAAAVAHELNQPLTGIRNFAKNASFMIENEAGTMEEVQQNLRQISAQVDRAARIISQMRELTRRQERQFAPVDVNGIVRESVEFLTPQFKLTGVEVSLEPGKGLPNVRGDRIRLEQVFLNLFANARQAMEETEERRLTVRTWLEESEHPMVAVQVADTGKGFSGEEHKKFFTPFYSTKKPGQGTGLGLSISLRIVRDHGGTISAVGAPGRGAAFTVRLPAPKDG